MVNFKYYPRGALEKKEKL